MREKCIKKGSTLEESKVLPFQLEICKEEVSLFVGQSPKCLSCVCAEDRCFLYCPCLPDLFANL